MLKGIMSQMLNGNNSSNSNNTKNPNINDFLGMIKGKSPEQIEGMARMLMQQNGGINNEQMKQFEQFAKMFGISDSQINDFKKKL